MMIGFARFFSRRRQLATRTPVWRVNSVPNVFVTRRLRKVVNIATSDGDFRNLLPDERSFLPSRDHFQTVAQHLLTEKCRWMQAFFLDWQKLELSPVCFSVSFLDRPTVTQ